MPTTPSPSQRLPRYLTQTDVSAFFAAINDLRDRTLFSLAYLYGLRVSEISLLERSDIDFARRRIVVRRVKNGVWTERPLFRTAERLLYEYLSGAVSSDVKSLFHGRNGPLQKRQIQDLFVRYRDAAGLPPHVGCHSLRHSIATHLLDAGVSLEFVQDHLGHKNIRSTSVYAKVTDQHRTAVFERLETSPWIVFPNGSDREVEPTVTESRP